MNNALEELARKWEEEAGKYANDHRVLVECAQELRAALDTVMVLPRHKAGSVPEAGKSYVTRATPFTDPIIKKAEGNWPLWTEANYYGPIPEETK